MRRSLAASPPHSGNVLWNLVAFLVSFDDRTSHLKKQSKDLMQSADSACMPAELYALKKKHAADGLPMQSFEVSSSACFNLASPSSMEDHPRHIAGNCLTCCARRSAVLYMINSGHLSDRRSYGSCGSLDPS